MTDTPRQVPLPVSVLMPVSNEADIIEGVVEEWVREVFQYLPEGSEYLFDEAGSVDGTREILARLCDKYPFIRVMSRDKKDGFAAAAKRLYLEAKCPLIFFTDSDGQYVAEDFWRLVKHIGPYDMVHGAKLGRKDPLMRRLSSMFFNKLAGFLFQVRYLDINSAFRLMKAEIAKEIVPKLNVMPTLLNAEFLLRTELQNYEIKQVYIRHRERRFGRSRGLPLFRYPLEALKAGWGLFQIKESYRK